MTLVAPPSFGLRAALRLCAGGHARPRPQVRARRAAPGRRGRRCPGGRCGRGGRAAATAASVGRAALGPRPRRASTAAPAFRRHGAAPASRDQPRGPVPAAAARHRLGPRWCPIRPADLRRRCPRPAPSWQLARRTPRRGPGGRRGHPASGGRGARRCPARPSARPRARRRRRLHRSRRHGRPGGPRVRRPPGRSRSPRGRPTKPAWRSPRPGLPTPSPGALLRPCLLSPRRRGRRAAHVPRRRPLPTTRSRRPTHSRVGRPTALTLGPGRGRWPRPPDGTSLDRGLRGLAPVSRARTPPRVRPARPEAGRVGPGARASPRSRRLSRLALRRPRPRPVAPEPRRRSRLRVQAAGRSRPALTAEARRMSVAGSPGRGTWRRALEHTRPWPSSTSTRGSPTRPSRCTRSFSSASPRTTARAPA